MWEHLAVQVAAKPRLSVLAERTAVPRSAGAEGLAAVLRVLGDPTRLAIAAMLFREEGPLCVCHVEAQFALSQPTISHHLRVLREARLVTSEKRGSWVYYALDRASVPAAVLPVLTAVELDSRAACACP